MGYVGELDAGAEHVAHETHTKAGRAILPPDAVRHRRTTSVSERRRHGLPVSAIRVRARQRRRLDKRSRVLYRHHRIGSRRKTSPCCFRSRTGPPIRWRRSPSRISIGRYLKQQRMDRIRRERGAGRNRRAAEFRHRHVCRPARRHEATTPCLPAGLFWIRAAVHENSDAVCRLQLRRGAGDGGGLRRPR